MANPLCFENYDNFLAWLKQHNRSTGSNYTNIQSSSVRVFNQKNGTDIRLDVKFIEAKYECRYKIKITKSSRKKKSTSNCPAYFLLQYNQKVDQLMITEMNSSHRHDNKRKYKMHEFDGKQFSTLKSSSVTTRKIVPKPQSPGAETTKLLYCNSVSLCNPAVKVDSVKEAIVTLRSASAPTPGVAGSISVLAEKLKHAPSSSSLGQVAEVIKEFLKADQGSMACISVGSSQDLERVSFQTSRMKNLFEMFPESLLLQRAQNAKGNVLYTFIIENKERVGKVVHFAVLNDETAEKLAKALKLFKNFNPKWSKTKVLFVESSFVHLNVLQDEFPASQILLSMYHTVRLVETTVKQTKARVPSTVSSALIKAVFSSSPANLSNLATELKDVLEQEFYDYLQQNWLSCEILWYMHVKKGSHACQDYMDSLDFINRKIKNLCDEEHLTLENLILMLVKDADLFNTKYFSKLDIGISADSNRRQEELGKRTTSRRCRKTESESLVRTVYPALPQASLNPKFKETLMVDKGLPLADCSTEACDEMELALWNSCTELGARLCTNEWKLTLMSQQLIHKTNEGISVQLLENTYQVDKDLKCCSCHYNSKYKLPCRHILSALHANKKCIGEEFVCRWWQKKYQNLRLPVTQSSSHLDTPETVSASSRTASERKEMVKSLTEELTNLIVNSDDAELEERYSTLRMIADIWTKPSDQVESDSACKAPSQNDYAGPFISVKTEEPAFCIETVKQEWESFDYCS
ncbi:zinc finger SWIM domain-containing protein 3 [Protopterus annectens]|uniref:zinc finger SWIM domain-containing protein 3 n=1 Tax=Protopterus annectens TaxID=7888 RepID=UPI001CFA2D98|nr:zinc finger SWIM domain-containing protein 3 [Protopterus annectens]